MIASILFSTINCRARSMRASRSSLVKDLACPERSGSAAIAGETEPAAAAPPCCARASGRKASRAAAEEPHKKLRRENIPHPTQDRYPALLESTFTDLCIYYRFHLECRKAEYAAFITRPMRRFVT